MVTLTSWAHSQIVTPIHQVKFMPVEEKFYEQRIAIRLSQSSQRILLLCRGQGQEPQIEFSK